MPPKPKISRDEILDCAYQLVMEQGLSALSSRNVARAAGCSIQPVFSHFPTMEDLRRELYRKACSLCAEEVLNDQSGWDFLTVLTHWMMDLAVNRPNLFELLYLSDVRSSLPLSELLVRSENHRRMAKKIARIHNLSFADADDVMVRICILLMGIGTMVCVNKMDITEQQVLQLMKRTASDLVSGVSAGVRSFHS